MKKLVNRRGFTLLETLIAVAVVVVLTGIAVPAIVNTNATLTTQQENDYAKSIFLAAQNNLVSLETNGGINSLEAEIPEDATIYTESGSDLKDDIKTALSTRAETLKAGDTEKQYVYVEKGKYDEPGDLFKKILPEDSIDSSILSGKKVTIIFNPVSGDVYCVKYGDKGEYFGSVVSYDKSKITVTPTVSLVNGEENLVYIKVPVPDEFLTGAESYLNAITFEITVTDADNAGNSFTYTLNSTSKSNGFAMNYVTHVATWAVDSLVTGRSFSERNNNAAEKTGNSIAAGSDICVSVDYDISDDAEYKDVEFDLSNSAPKDPVNSLYASCDSNAITVSNGRHLQNLNNIDETLAASLASSGATVKLSGNIFWGETVKHYSSLSGDLTYYGTGETSFKRFVPLKAEKLFADGSSVNVDGCSNTIHNLYIYGLSDDAGMFENLLVSVSNLTFTDPIVKGGGNAGTLAAAAGYVESGSRTNSITVSNCQVLFENDSVSVDSSILDGSNPVDGNTSDFYGACSVQNNSVGQLIGAAYDITIFNSSVNTGSCDVPASGVNFGLLIGYAENCIVDSCSATGSVMGGGAANIGFIAGCVDGNSTSMVASTADGSICNIKNTYYDSQSYPCVGGAVGHIFAGSYSGVSADVQITNVVSEDSRSNTTADRTHKCPAGLGTVGKFVGYINNLSEGTDDTIYSSPVSFLNCSGVGSANYDYQFLGVIDYVKNTSTGEFYLSTVLNNSSDGIVADLNTTTGVYTARDKSMDFTYAIEVVYYNYPDIVMSESENVNTYVNSSDQTKIQYIDSDLSYLYNRNISQEYNLETTTSLSAGDKFFVYQNGKLLTATKNNHRYTASVIDASIGNGPMSDSEYNTYKSNLWTWVVDTGFFFGHKINMLGFIGDSSDGNSTTAYVYINSYDVHHGYQHEVELERSGASTDMSSKDLSFKYVENKGFMIYRDNWWGYGAASFKLGSSKTETVWARDSDELPDSCYFNIYKVSDPVERYTFNYNNSKIDSQCIGSK